MLRHLGCAVAIAATAWSAVACSNDDFTDVPSEAPTAFQWTRAEDMETRNDFLRNFGVGYSYNAVRGEFCNWEDIRCQVVNRYKVLELERRLNTTFFSIDQSESVSTSSLFNYSQRDYVANIDISSKEAVSFGLYNGEKRRRQHVMEDGLQEKFYYSLDERVQKLNMTLQDASLLEAYESGNYEVLTRSFQQAVWHLAGQPAGNIASVDSFINIYGTHVIVEAWLGGRLRIDLMNDMWRYNDQTKEEAWTAEEFLGASLGRDEHRHGNAAFTWLESGRLNIEALGGDQSTLTSLLGEHQYDGTRTFSTEGVSNWRRSLKYVPSEELESTVELIDMRLRSIWDFVAAIDPDVAIRVKAAVLRDAALQQALLGERNFFDTRFPVRYTTAEALIHTDGDQWQTVRRTDEATLPQTVLIESGGRYVAMVCREAIAGQMMWVAYPIYEGRLKLACGLGVSDDGRAWHVRWLGSRCYTEAYGDVQQTDWFYVNGGSLDFFPQEGIKYDTPENQYHALPAVELSGGIRSDGSYVAVSYPVEKQGTAFVCRAPHDIERPFVGWTWDNALGLWLRDSDYFYSYNPNELRFASEK
jgi:hypothetical protein